MSVKCGIIGLPNVGKSTLFNALTSTQAAEAANYPFCTIEPNVGKVAVPDPRLIELAHMAGSKEIIATQIEFVDIAGLVKDASKGEGLGNQFLGHIREMDALIHVVRCFEEPNITHVETTIDPLRDIGIIDIELLLADIENLEKRLISLEKKVKVKDKDGLAQNLLIEKLLPPMRDGTPVRALEIKEEEQPVLRMLQLLTAKPIMYVCNVAENEVNGGNVLAEKVADYACAHKSQIVVVSAKIESEIALIDDEKAKKEFLELMEYEETGLSRIILAAFTLLNLISFFTIGPKEAHAWTVPKNARAPQAAGEIHTDFEKGFIRAETISYADFVLHKGEQKVKEAGKMRLEGKDYVIQDGDIFHFRFNV